MYQIFFYCSSAKFTNLFLKFMMSHRRGQFARAPGIQFLVYVNNVSN